jgi:DNA-binding GntR family transcriptional regulator
MQMPRAIPLIERTSMSEATAAAVRNMIVDGQLGAGVRINEVHLSQRLGVSRTPLREALNRLASEGALTSTPGLGYFVRPLTVEDFEQVYSIRPILDLEALRLAGIPSRKRLDRLQRLNKTLAAARDPETAIALDDEWHRELVADCPNRVLIELIENMMLRTRRYEIALMRETRNILRTTEDHEGVLKALYAADLEGACAALKQNMMSGKPPIIAWLKNRDVSQRGVET